MSSDRNEVRLGDIAKLVTKGTTPTTVGHAFRSSGVNFVKSESIGFDGRIDQSKFAFIDTDAHEALKRSQLCAGDLLFSMAGVYIGKTAVVSGDILPANTNQAVGIIRLDQSKANPRFIDYYIRNPSYNRFLNNLVSQSAQPNFNLAEIKGLPIVLPSLDLQLGICELLGCLDDRITLLRETNATLEAIAQALFKSWFVDFDPVRAKAEGFEPEGMDAATAALFPDSFEESELGLVPRGWMVRSLDSIANYLNGLAMQKFPPTDDGWLPVIKIAQLRKGNTVGADRAGRNIKTEYIIQNGDVLFSWSGSLEVVIWCGGEGALNQHLFKVTSKDFPKWFYYLWTRQHLTDFQQTAASKATTMGHIQRKHLTAAKVVVPPTEMLRSAGVLIEPLLERWLVNAEKAQTLTQLRDTLLPRLISGQLRLPEAEEMVEEVCA
ncbi:restriction endonuclease subunit S [Pseudomonas fragi]|uniref:restriction endonuclease subunit S n=1 Tax=Pseudomonas fragi TaxID=296 RepID=UPI002954CCA0|nr:restriction endonuclease subunit S [Pseudomonas fragi]WOL30520.1 restriction endonuclease subunit S [Pseudomonas fragi]